MDITEALRGVENSLRDFISEVLLEKHGEKWISNVGVSQNRIDIWGKRLEEERKKMGGRLTEARLLYYADFYDLKPIISSNWDGSFCEVFKKKKRIEVFLSELEKLRNPEAHRRDLLPHHKHMIIGISEEIRNQIIKYRSMKENKSVDDYYPRFERITDNLGNVWSPENKSRRIMTNDHLRVGDKLVFIVSATDPYGENLMYSFGTNILDRNIRKWQAEKEFELIIDEEMIRKNLTIRIRLKSQRNFHARNDHDDEVKFTYIIIPPIYNV